MTTPLPAARARQARSGLLDGPQFASTFEGEASSKTPPRLIRTRAACSVPSRSFASWGVTPAPEIGYTAAGRACAKAGAARAIATRSVLKLTPGILRHPTEGVHLTN